MRNRVFRLLLEFGLSQGFLKVGKGTHRSVKYQRSRFDRKCAVTRGRSRIIDDQFVGISERGDAIGSRRDGPGRPGANHRAERADRAAERESKHWMATLSQCQSRLRPSART